MHYHSAYSGLFDAIAYHCCSQSCLVIGFGRRTGADTADKLIEKQSITAAVSGIILSSAFE